MTMQRRPWTVGDAAFRQGVAANIDGIVKRAEIMACKTERENVSNLISGVLSFTYFSSNFKIMAPLQRSPLSRQSPT